MITTEEGLAVSRQALAHLEAAYDSLRRDLKPKNERLFAVIAEGYIDQLLDVRDEIDAYLGIKRSAPDDVPASLPPPPPAAADPLPVPTPAG